jgi:hypothetical protein
VHHCTDTQQANEERDQLERSLHTAAKAQERQANEMRRLRAELAVAARSAMGEFESVQVS